MWRVLIGVACVSAAAARGCSDRPTVSSRLASQRRESVRQRQTGSSALALEKAVPAQAAAMRLRGGEGSALMAVQRAYTGIPLITRSWFTLILILAAFNQIGVLQPEAVALDAAAIRRWQLWRPITAAAFFGGIGPQLLQKMYYLVQFGKGLESVLGLGEYARALASCSAMLCIFCNLLGWQFFGDGLVMSMTVLTCQQQPDAQMNMYGLNIPMAYMPFAQMVMSYVFSQQIPWNDLVGAIVGYIHYYIQDEVKPDAVIHKREKAAGGGGAASKTGHALGGGKSAAKGGSVITAGASAPTAARCWPERGQPLQPAG
jgi:hypothetical protein